MDRGQRDTERIVKRIKSRIDKEYRLAIGEIEDGLKGYFKRFEKKDETWRKWVTSGERTKDEWAKWRVGQMAAGKRWDDQKSAIAQRLVTANSRAKQIIYQYAPEVYAENFNFATYQVEKDAKITTAFTLYSKESVERLVKDDPDILPAMGRKTAQNIAEGKAIRWNRQHVQSVMIQGIMQGDSIPKLATRLATKVGDSDRKAAIRNARTLMTGTQNAGRVAAYKRAQDIGVDLEQMWIATLDGRTRHSHRWLDGEIRPVGEQFSNGLEYPADPHGDASEVYNCRCSLRGVVKGLEAKARQYRDTSAIDGMSYDEWRNAKATSKDIEAPDKVARSAKQGYLASYRNNGIIQDNKTSGAISGALNPYGKEAQNHADIYYESVRHMSTDYAKIAENTGFAEQDVLNIKNYVFNEEHDLGNGKLERFYPNYDMAQSWQRMIEGKNIQDHDITLLNHENMERDLVLNGYSQKEAHNITSKTYNYAKEANEYNDRIKGNQKN